MWTNSITIRCVVRWSLLEVWVQSLFGFSPVLKKVPYFKTNSKYKENNHSSAKKVESAQPCGFCLSLALLLQPRFQLGNRKKDARWLCVLIMMILSMANTGVKWDGHVSWSRRKLFLQHSSVSVTLINFSSLHQFVQSLWISATFIIFCDIRQYLLHSSIFSSGPNRGFQQSFWGGSRLRLGRSCQCLPHLLWWSQW